MYLTGYLPREVREGGGGSFLGPRWRGGVTVFSGLLLALPLSRGSGEGAGGLHFNRSGTDEEQEALDRSTACFRGSSAVALPGAAIAAPDTLTGNVTISATASYPNGLVIAPGATVSAPAGHSLTLTVNGVEMGQKLVTTAGMATAFVPGTYFGNVIITVADENLVMYQPAGPPGPENPPVAYAFRQALYLDASGVDTGKSVLAALMGTTINHGGVWDAKIASQGECFNGVFVAGGEYLLKNPKISLVGNGRSDFIGYGAAIVARGVGTKLVVDGADIYTNGVVRAGVVADDGANVVVKNSRIRTYDGVLPADYLGTVDTSQMRAVPWMLGLTGNVRATNLLGTDTKAAYINSYIASQGWGVLSTDGCTTPKLTAINSTITVTGQDGYGSYGIGDATERFLGCTFNVATYATISRGSFLYFGDSTRAAVAQLNSDLDLGLGMRELQSLAVTKTVVNSKRFGVMWHGGGTLDISGGTQFNTAEATFLDKGQAIAITVDGSKGARLNPANHVLLQVMDDDDPGPTMPGMMNNGVYTEPTGMPAKVDTHDVTVADATDAVATFANINLDGDFYNGTRGGIVAVPFGPPSDTSKDMALTFSDSRVAGLITASTAKHKISTMAEADYRDLGVVTNTPSVAINNGVIVSLTNGSKWIVSGTCYLTKLSLDASSSVIADFGRVPQMTVDGVPTKIVPGNTYSGAIVLTLSQY
jgi:hypothetical protein